MNGALVVEATRIAREAPTAAPQWQPATPSQAAAAALADAQQRRPRAGLCPQPTPLEPLRRFSAAIGAEVWIKRDDIGPLGLAGAKVRKIDRVIAQALLAGARRLVTCAPARSNTARVLACAAARAGLPLEILVAGAAPAVLGDNMLLASLFGARLAWCGDASAAGVEAAARARAAAVDALFVPYGATTSEGVIGMVAGHAECLRQLRHAGVEAGAIYHASATGGMWAGLELGAALGGGPAPVAVMVENGLYGDPRRAYADAFNAAAAELGCPLRRSPEQVRLDWQALGEGYERPTRAGLEAAALLARTEGIVCDLTYTAKALAALVADARAGRLAAPAVFWHTAGPASTMGASMQAALAEAV